VRVLDWSPARPGLRAVALVPARTLADAARTMGPGVKVSISFSAAGADAAGAGAAPPPADGMISFESAGRQLATRLIAGEFIRYQSRFPGSFGCRAEVPAASFTEAVRRVSLVADRASPVRLSFGQGAVAIEAATEGRARAVETVTASFHGDQPVISFNPHFLLDGLVAAAAADRQAGAAAEEAGAAKARPAPSQVAIRLDFTSPARPALITRAEAAGEEAPGGVPSFRYLVVPLRPAGG